MQQGAALVSSLTGLLVAGGSLAALLVSAVAVDPFAALVVIVAVVVLGSVLRPLRAAVKRQARQTAKDGNGIRHSAERDIATRYGDARVQRATAGR